MEHKNELTPYLKALLILELKKLPEEDKPELLLSDAGFSIGDIASLLGKNYKTVSKTIERSRKKLASK